MRLFGNIREGSVVIVTVEARIGAGVRQTHIVFGGGFDRIHAERVSNDEQVGPSIVVIIDEETREAPVRRLHAGVAGYIRESPLRLRGPVASDGPVVMQQDVVVALYGQ